MKPTPNPGIEVYRRVHPLLGASPAGVNWGYFRIGQLSVIASDELGWDHVSVSRKDRVPTWDEMCRIKDLWFGADETVLQFHPRKPDYINNCGTCLHLWKRQGAEIELPPGWMVGIRVNSKPKIPAFWLMDRHGCGKPALGFVRVPVPGEVMRAGGVTDLKGTGLHPGARAKCHSCGRLLEQGDLNVDFIVPAVQP